MTAAPRLRQPARPPHNEKRARAILPCLAVLLLGCISQAAAAEQWIQEHPLRRIKSETLAYKVTSWKGLRLFTMDLGTATFTINHEEALNNDGRPEPQIAIQAVATGGPPGYSYNATITSRLRESDLSQLSEANRRVSPGYKTRLLRWHSRGMDVLKHSHCECPTLCHNPDHFIQGPDGSLVHCVDCENPKHFVWSMRERHRGYFGRTQGLIAALYMARGLDVKPGGREHALRVVSNRNIWDVYFKVDKEVTVPVPAGKIPCYKLKLRFQGISKYAKKHAFEGPFGLEGNIGLYVDKQTRQVVMVSGQVDLGATFDVEIKLTQRQTTYADATP